MSLELQGPQLPQPVPREITPGRFPWVESARRGPQFLADVRRGGDEVRSPLTFFTSPLRSHSSCPGRPGAGAVASGSGRPARAPRPLGPGKRRRLPRRGGRAPSHRLPGDPGAALTGTWAGSRAPPDSCPGALLAGAPWRGGTERPRGRQPARGWGGTPARGEPQVGRRRRPGPPVRALGRIVPPAGARRSRGGAERSCAIRAECEGLPPAQAPGGRRARRPAWSAPRSLTSSPGPVS